MYKIRRKTYILFLGVTVGVIIFHNLGWLASLEEAVRIVINPASDRLYQIKTEKIRKEQFSSYAELEQAYYSLEDKYVKNTIDYTRLLLIQEENNNLRKQLQYTVSSAVEYVGARVIGRDIEPIGRSILINKGESSGIYPHYPVITHEGVLVGVVAQVQKHTALVRMISDNQSKIAATIINKKKSIGLVEGGFGISVHMNFIPQNEQIHIGDTVITSGLSEYIPHGLLIGFIEAVQKETYQPFQEAVINPIVPFDSIRLVSVAVPVDKE